MHREWKISHDSSALCPTLSRAVGGAHGSTLLVAALGGGGRLLPPSPVLATAAPWLGSPHHCCPRLHAKAHGDPLCGDWCGRSEDCHADGRPHRQPTTASLAHQHLPGHGLGLGLGLFQLNNLIIRIGYSKKIRIQHVTAAAPRCEGEDTLYTLPS